jgi:peptidoglycan hydrolase CwlO-like protein
MFFEWSLLTLLCIVAIYLFVKMFYFKSITNKEQRSNDLMKLTLQEAEILIRKYQIQLQRALGNVDILSDELTKLRNELKVLKQRNTKHRQETDRLNNKIKALESRIDALL